MSTRLVILGMLQKRPLYGYEIKSIIEKQMGDWTNIAFGSIYFALNKLADNEFIEKIATEQDGNRPSRSVYQITESGRNEFLRLLRETLKEPSRQYYDFDIGLFFMDSISNDEIIGYLNYHIGYLKKAAYYVAEHKKNTNKENDITDFANLIFDHSYVHLQAEIKWLQDVLKKIEEKM